MRSTLILLAFMLPVWTVASAPEMPRFFWSEPTPREILAGQAAKHDASLGIVMAIWAKESRKGWENVPDGEDRERGPLQVMAGTAALVDCLWDRNPEHLSECGVKYIKKGEVECGYARNRERLQVYRFYNTGRCKMSKGRWSDAYAIDVDRAWMKWKMEQ